MTSKLRDYAKLRVSSREIVDGGFAAWPVYVIGAEIVYLNAGTAEQQLSHLHTAAIARLSYAV